MLLAKQSAAASQKHLSAASSATEFLSVNAKTLGLTEKHKFKALSETSDENGSRHVRLNQTINGVPVYGAQVTVHTGKDFVVNAVLGKTTRQTPGINTTPALERASAVQKAKELFYNEGGFEANFTLKADLYVYNPSLMGNTQDGGNHLAWLVQLMSRKPPKNKIYIIDAQNGKLLRRLTAQHSIFREIWDCSRNSKCELDVYDAATGYTYGRSEGQAARGGNPADGTTDTDRAYDVANTIHNYFAANFGRDGANEQGGMGYGPDYSIGTTTLATHIESFYTDGCPNAFFDGIGGIYFCKGTISTDIAAHEYTHALDYFAIKDGYGQYSGLAYENESGALNEAFSDIFGEAVENFETGSSDWAAGTGSVLGILRDLKNPSRMPLYQPDRTYSPFVNCCPSGAFEGNDYCWVHQNSTIMDHAAYLMAEGGSTNGCNITGVGRQAEERILYQTLTHYLTVNSNFQDAFNAINSACQELYPGSATCKEVTKALYAVELNQPGRCSGEQRQDPAELCAAVDNGIFPIATPTAVPTLPPTPTPTTPSPTITPEFRVRAGAGKNGAVKTVTGGKPVFITLSRAISSGAAEDSALLFASVDGKLCTNYFQVPVGDAEVTLTSKFPKLPKASKVMFLSANASNVTGTAKITVKGEKRWTSKTKSIKPAKICSHFAANLK